MELMVAEVIFAEKTILPVQIWEDCPDGNKPNKVPSPKEKSSN
jgi:hypothetical protein